MHVHLLCCIHVLTYRIISLQTLTLTNASQHTRLVQLSIRVTVSTRLQHVLLYYYLKTEVYAQLSRTAPMFSTYQSFRFERNLDDDGCADAVQLVRADAVCADAVQTLP